MPGSGVTETRFRALGSDLHVVVVGGTDHHHDQAHARIDDLESRWSRFRPDSELSRLNATPGRPTIVSADTYGAVVLAIDAWRTTEGRYDPTVLPALVAAGYDRDFAALPAEGPSAPESAPAPGCGAIGLDPVVRSITLPPGVMLDLGGIGKGLAADLVVEDLLAAGAAGACVNAGGDLRAAGAPPSEDGWVVDVEHLPGILLALADGAVATSSTLGRRWQRGGTTMHHLIDPRTGAPAAGGLVAVTVVAGRASRAEVLAKAAFVAGAAEAPDVLAAAGATGILVTEDDRVVELAGLADYLR